MYKPGTHLHVPGGSESHAPELDGAIGRVASVCERAGVVGYDEGGGVGVLRYCQFSVEVATGKVHVAFVVTDLDDEMVLKAARQTGGEEWSGGVWLHKNVKWRHSSAVFDYDGEWRHVHGPKYVEEEGLGGVTLR